MSRIGKQPIEIPSGVEVTIADRNVKLKGPKGELEYNFLPQVEVIVEDNTIIIKRPGDDKESRSIHGLTRALVNNMVIGVSKGFEKRLEIIGVGYRAQASGQKITLNLGFSHPIDYTAPEGVLIEMDKENKNIIIISGIDKQAVGEAAANIRKYRPPEPYKGKGVRYIDEYVARKAGKAAAKAAA
ncbi:50S ribosomal protein L6 [Candidatus Pacearchaeota archaeon]|nr:50S ribosomal protein L6 [Candidatus Pacearchaeota archaeon]